MKTDLQMVDDVMDDVESLIEHLCPKYKRFIVTGQSICIPPNCLLGDAREVRGMNCRLCAVKELLREIRTVVIENE